MTTTPEGVITIESPFASTDQNLREVRRDGILVGVPNNGVRFIADLGFGFCYPGGPLEGRPAATSPTNGQTIYDLAEIGNGSAVVASGQTIAYSGGGFDYSSITAQNNYAGIPASVAADIYAAFAGASQRFMVVAYFKLPAKADWNGAAAIAPMLSWASGNASVSNSDMITIGQNSTSYRLSAIRQTAGSTLVETNIPMNDADFGVLGQVTYWRNAAGIGLSLRTARTRTNVFGAVGADNTGNFSSQIGKLGIGNSYWAPGTPASGNAVKFRAYRLFVENLARSGRDPLTVAEADWLLTQDRISRSAAANGGVSRIFN
ncbi:hypothetical protein [Serratia fonticola]|uniref:hypothetical protein n=1 Tax=Serratia fonticola TaxID=47917 RepID=UPI00093AF8AD|nr:hypothetical protein [Serratia fonticola]OKP27673.1 hypothetical protein BSQ40_15090 [Serratia fonticola]